MKIVAVLASIGACAMIAILAFGFVTGDFGAEGRQLLAMPWGVVSLVDLYVGFLLFASWIIFREGVTLRSFCWVASVMILGNLAVCLYLLACVRSSGGDWASFFLGRHVRAL